MTKILYRIIRKVLTIGRGKTISRAKTMFTFWGNNVSYSTFRTSGCPYINTRKTGSIIIGSNFAMNNGMAGNNIGFNVPCTFVADNGCKIVVGSNVGISQTALIAHADITIGNNVKIGGGTCIYTSDFHSLDADKRRSPLDAQSRKQASVIIEDDVFIGARCLILKGVTIGSKSIVGAGSVVTKSIPANEIWAGNPAHFIRKISVSKEC